MPSTTTRRSAAERVTQIAETAQSLARDAGLGGVTLRGIAREMGVAPALVAHYAPSMDALVAETFDAIVGAELIEVGEIIRSRQAPTEALAALLASLLDERRADVTLIWVQSWALGSANETLAVSVREQMDAWRTFLARVIGDGRDAAAFRCDDPEAVAAQVLGMVDGLNAHSLVAWQHPGERVRLLLRSVEAMLDLPGGALVDQVAANSEAQLRNR